MTNLTILIRSEIELTTDEMKEAVKNALIERFPHIYNYVNHNLEITAYFKLPSQIILRNEIAPVRKTVYRSKTPVKIEIKSVGSVFNLTEYAEVTEKQIIVPKGIYGSNKKWVIQEESNFTQNDVKIIKLKYEKLS